ncbi:MAG: prepilin-type N-terminal cleavage/methylation domain-containing protein [Clostridiales Family XIII bacterium]|jgi:prepilin-type N-terminal cleavage/methylation domain-containing protein|nr:prepilin-type N-terminal cleavage/methylation domain-containing protein [Clostridiales Family XIII bacterium]
MKMIFKKQWANRKGRHGFTLVEVIVVLVILAILAAIAIPALTGYIDKAEDKKYIAQARNAMVSLRSVINEAYVDGELDKLNATQMSTLVTSGMAISTDHLKFFNVGGIPEITVGSWPDFYIRAAKLTAEPFPANASLMYTQPSWLFYFYAPNPSSHTLFDAPAFRYDYYPNGMNSGSSKKPYIHVYYGVKGVKLDSSGTKVLQDDAIYDPGAGYTVFHVNP